MRRWRDPSAWQHPEEPAPLSDAGRAFQTWAAPPPGKDGKPRKRSYSGASLVKKASEETDAIRLADEWHRAQPRHLVALYGWLHLHVYKVEAAELATDWPGAVSAARSMLAKEFGDDPARMVEYLRWAFVLEAAKEKKRDRTSTFRMGWRLVFVSRSLLTDFRVAKARGIR